MRISGVAGRASTIPQGLFPPLLGAQNIHSSSEILPGSSRPGRASSRDPGFCLQRPALKLPVKDMSHVSSCCHRPLERVVRVRVR